MCYTKKKNLLYKSRYAQTKDELQESMNNLWTEKNRVTYIWFKVSYKYIKKELGRDMINMKELYNKKITIWVDNIHSRALICIGWLLGLHPK